MAKLLNIVILAFALAFSALTAMAAGPVNINTATAEEIADNVKGLGPTKAAAIVQYREAHGPFTALEELTQVPGIGDKTLENIGSQITLGEETSMETAGEESASPMEENEMEENQAPAAGN